MCARSEEHYSRTRDTVSRCTVSPTVERTECGATVCGASCGSVSGSCRRPLLKQRTVIRKDRIAQDVAGGCGVCVPWRVDMTGCGLTGPSQEREGRAPQYGIYEYPGGRSGARGAPRAAAVCPMAADARVPRAGRGQGSERKRESHISHLSHTGEQVCMWDVYICAIPIRYI